MSTRCCGPIAPRGWRVKCEGTTPMLLRCAFSRLGARDHHHFHMSGLCSAVLCWYGTVWAVSIVTAMPLTSAGVNVAEPASPRWLTAGDICVRHHHAGHAATPARHAHDCHHRGHGSALREGAHGTLPQFSNRNLVHAPGSSHLGSWVPVAVAEDAGVSGPAPPASLLMIYPIASVRGAQHAGAGRTVELYTD